MESVKITFAELDNNLKRFNNEIHAKNPDLIKLIKSALLYLRFDEQMSLITENFKKNFTSINLILSAIENKSKKNRVQTLDVEPINQHQKFFHNSIDQIKFIKSELVKTSKQNLKKDEIQNLIIEVSELKFITKIENPELKDSINFYNELVDFLKTIVQHIQDNQDIKTPLQLGQAKPEKKPFRDDSTAELFEYIVKHWNYNAATKWGYIWNYFFQKGNGKMTFKIDYETYLIERGLMTKGKPNYEACSSSKRYDQLDELKRQYLENLDLK
jgi:hypothetical protein